MKEKISIGYDFAAKPKIWWQKVLYALWPRYRRRFSDMSCIVAFKHHLDGTIEVVDHKYF